MTLTASIKALVATLAEIPTAVAAAKAALQDFQTFLAANI